MFTVLEDKNAPVPSGNRVPFRLSSIIMGGRDGLILLQDRFNQLSALQRRTAMSSIYEAGSSEQKKIYNNSFELFYQVSLGMSCLLVLRNRNIIHSNNTRYCMAVVGQNQDKSLSYSTSITTLHIKWALQCVGARVLTYLHPEYGMNLGSGVDDPSDNNDPGLPVQEAAYSSVSKCLDTVIKTRIALYAVVYRTNAGQERFLYETAAAVLCVVVVKEVGLSLPTEDYYQALVNVRNTSFAHNGGGILIQNNIIEYLNLDENEWRQVEELLKLVLKKARAQYATEFQKINPI